MFTNTTNQPVSYVVNGDVILVQPGQQVSDSGAISNPTIQQAALAGRTSLLTISQQLTEWTTGEDYQVLTATRNADGVVTTATVKWPDDTTGTFTATNYNATFAVYDGFTITHDASSNVVTQPAVTRDANSAVIAKPAIGVS